MSKELTSSFQLGAGTTLNFFDGWGLLPAPSTPGRVDVDIAGTISVGTDDHPDSTAFWTGAVGYYAELAQGSSLSVQASGRLVVNSTWPGGQGYGVYGAGWAPDISNAGLIDVTAPGAAYGIYSSAPNTFAVSNSGTIKAAAEGGVVRGVFIGRGGSFLNTGDITATGSGSAISGVELRYSGVDGTFLNKGSIKAVQLDPVNGLASGVVFGWHTTFENQGVITGGYALKLQAGSGHVSGQTYHFINSGTMNGIVDLGGASPAPGREVLHNSGTIRGDVNFGAEGDTLDGIGGTIIGVVHGNGGDDLLSGGLGAATIFGDAGADTIGGAAGSSYLRGDDGDDSISGGTGFDDINGNQGADTAHGNDGDDWVVGGKDNDLLFGDAGHDIVYGNLGDDTVSGDAGVDWVRGGQGDDSVSGGAGDDWLWGDRGNDTISGGSGADIFHSFSGAGLDRVTDFSLAEGDRVQLDPGTTYTVRQVGSDTVIDLGGGDQVVLVGVQAATLAATSIFVG
jgi:Ca2+-binding RTX toxin-like protein